MKYIQKSKEPKKFRDWKVLKKGTNDPNVDYDSIPSDIKAEILESLLEEQGYICAYTGIGIQKESSHIEHLLPQTHCTKGQEDVDYQNIVACFPSKNAKRKCPYGAHKKGSWPPKKELKEFISPLSNNCESSFKFLRNGKMECTNSNDAAASTTLDKLNLNHKELQDLRKAAYSSVTENLKLDGAKRRQKQIMKFNSNGKLEPFCFVKKKALEKFIIMKEAIRKNKSKK